MLVEPITGGILGNVWEMWLDSSPPFIEWRTHRPCFIKIGCQMFGVVVHAASLSADFGERSDVNKMLAGYDHLDGRHADVVLSQIPQEELGAAERLVRARL